ncbi:hypothetical protein [Limosilactobacillus ingluviei]|uniref:hypothetical protein n=1 Tax=Limosilactobacillus ingluviei TaxID=148604 RepID=UPI000704E51E|nr:hypothetical protein [Limosilactobacillus ingluviei]
MDEQLQKKSFMFGFPQKQEFYCYAPDHSSEVTGLFEQAGREYGDGEIFYKTKNPRDIVRIYVPAIFLPSINKVLEVFQTAMAKDRYTTAIQVPLDAIDIGGAWLMPMVDPKTGINFVKTLFRVLRAYTIRGVGVGPVMCKLGEGKTGWRSDSGTITLTWDWDYQTTHDLFPEIDRSTIDKQMEKKPSFLN